MIFGDDQGNTSTPQCRVWRDEVYASPLGTYSLARVKGNRRYQLDELGR